MAIRRLRVAFAFPCLITILGIVGCGGSSSGGGGTGLSVSVAPKRAAVVATTQTLQFTATITGSAQNSPVGTDAQSLVTWSVDGTDGGNAAAGTITGSGLYTPPAGAGTHTVKATSTSDPTKSGSATVAVTDLAGVATY